MFNNNNNNFIYIYINNTFFCLPCSPGSHSQWSTAACPASPSPSPLLLSRLRSGRAPRRPLRPRHPVVSVDKKGGRGQGGQGRVAEGGVSWAALGQRRCWTPVSSQVSFQHLPSTYPHLNPGVTSAFCSSMTTVATWLDFTSLLGWHHLLFSLSFFFFS